MVSRCGRRGLNAAVAIALLIGGGCTGRQGGAEDKSTTVAVASTITTAPLASSATAPLSSSIDNDRAAERYRALYAEGLITDERADADQNDVQALFERSFPDNRPCDDHSIELTEASLDGTAPAHVVDYAGLIVAFCPLIDPDHLAAVVQGAAPKSSPADLVAIVRKMVAAVADI